MYTVRIILTFKCNENISDLARDGSTALESYYTLIVDFGKASAPVRPLIVTDLQSFSEYVCYIWVIEESKLSAGMLKSKRI